MKAMKIDPSEMTYTTSYKKCGEILRSKKETHTFAIFNELMKLMPLTQPKPDQTCHVSTLAGADQERHALRAYGYTGPLYVNEILQKTGFSLDSKHQEVKKPFDPVALDKQLATSVATYSECRQKGVRPPDVYVGPGAAGADNAAAVKAFQKMQLQNLPHPMALQMNGEFPSELNSMLHMMDMLNT